MRRVRSDSDKRVVTIVLTEFGRNQIHDIINMFLEYGQKVMAHLKSEEITLLTSVVTKVVGLLQDNPVELPETEKKIRKIVIE